jgi:hypothetical protein
MGLANLCVAQDQVRAEATILAQEIAECSPLGLLATRATMCAGLMCASLADRVMAATTHELAEQTRLRATEDFKEGVKVTEERRVANFKGGGEGRDIIQAVVPAKRATRARAGIHTPCCLVCARCRTASFASRICGSRLKAGTTG